MLVPRNRLAEAEAIAKRAAENFVTGPPVTRGRRWARWSARPSWKDYEGISGRESPTGFSNVASTMTIAEDEIFGPVLVILPFDDEADAIRIANDSAYGLAAGVWSGDSERAIRAARQLHAGQVDVNGGNFNPMAPFGGYKQSGFGREAGSFGFEEFLEAKSIQR